MIALILVFLLAFPCLAHDHPEHYYQAQWCAEHGGEVEVVMPDGTRCDCVTSENAVEVEFGAKMYESLSSPPLWSHDGETLRHRAYPGRSPGL